MFDEENAVYPVHVIGKLVKIDPGVVDKLLLHADALVERKRQASYYEFEREEGNPIVPNPWVLLKNSYRAAANFVIAAHRPTHVLMPTYHEGAWGRDGMSCLLPVRTQITISRELAEAAVFYIERNQEEIVRKAGITAQELIDLRRFSGGVETSAPSPMAIRP